MRGFQAMKNPVQFGTKTRSLRKGVFALAAAALLMTSCSSTPNGDQSNKDQQGNSLVLYSASATGTDELIEAFNEAYPEIDVQMVSGSSGELLGRVAAEKDHTLGDVLWAAGDHGIHSPELFEKVPDSLQANIIPEFALASGYGVPFNVYVNTFIYNTDLVPSNEAPQTWADLADPKWEGKIYMADPISSGGTYATMADWVTVGGWELVEAIAKNALIVEGSSSPIRAVSGGEVEIGIASEGFLSMLEESDNAEMVNPLDGASVLPGTLFMLKDSPNPENAELFIEWLTSEEGQTLMTSLIPGGRPVIEGVDAVGVPALDEVEIIPSNEDADTDRDEWVANWQEIITSL